MFHVELYGEFVLCDGLRKSDVLDTFLLPSSGSFYHTYDCVLMVALAVCVM
jgi:hypothetical protein